MRRPDQQKDHRCGLRPVRRAGSCWGTAAVPRARLGGLGRGAGRCAGGLRGSWCLAVSRRGEFLRGAELDPAGPARQPACPVGRADGLGRGHRQRGPVQRPERRRGPPPQRHLDLGLWLTGEAARGARTSTRAADQHDQVLVLANFQRHAASLALRRRLARRAHTGAAASTTRMRPLSASNSG